MLDRGGYVYAMFMDLSKAFDTIHHDLMIFSFLFQIFVEAIMPMTTLYMPSVITWKR